MLQVLTCVPLQVDLQVQTTGVLQTWQCGLSLVLAVTFLPGPAAFSVLLTRVLSASWFVLA